MATTSKTSAAAPRSDYKAGTRVKVTRRTGAITKGIVVDVITKTTGAFIRVNIGRKDEPLLISARPAKVRGY